MNAIGSPPQLDVRLYKPEDEAHVLDLLGRALGPGPTGSRTVEFFKWKHLDNVFGRSLMLVAEDEGRLVGFRSFMSWEFHARGQQIRAYRPVDTATHPEYQGRGIFSRLTRAAIEMVWDEGHLVFNTPNPASLAGYLKMGWEVVGKVPVNIKVSRPFRMVAGFRSIKQHSAPSKAPAVEARTALEALSSARISALVDARPNGMTIETPRTLDFLRWRYAAAPSLDYRVVTAEASGAVEGAAIFRVRPRGRLWEATVSELIVPEGDRAVTRRLLRQVVRAARVDHVTYRSAPGVGSTTTRKLPTPVGITLAARRLGRVTDVDPLRLESWSVSLGDLEVF